MSSVLKELEILEIENQLLEQEKSEQEKQKLRSKREKKTLISVKKRFLEHIDKISWQGNNVKTFGY